MKLAQGRIHVGIICRDARITNEILRSRQNEEIVFQVYDSIRAFPRTSPVGLPWAGILVQLELAVSSSTAEKGKLRELQRHGLPWLEFATEVTDEAWAPFELRILSEGLRDSRISPRFRRIVRVELLPAGNSSPLRMVTADISAGGCFVVHHETMPRGTQVLARIGDSADLVEAEVVWARDWNRIDNEWPGLGLRFNTIPDSAKVEVERYITEML